MCCSSRMLRGEHKTMWKDSFHFLSKPFDQFSTVYHHKLPEDNSGLHVEPPRLEEEYEEFDTVIHCTSFKSLADILQSGCLEPRLVSDSSVCNPERELFPPDNTKVNVDIHPLVRSNVLWFGPYTKAKAADPYQKVERYGNIAFTANDLDVFFHKDACNFYFIETIHFRYQTATRILVTRKQYPTLRTYNPDEIGGPWYYDKESNRHWCLTKTKHHEGRVVKNTLEFMREYDTKELLGDRTIMFNLSVSYKECPADRSRSGVDVVNDGPRGELRMTMGIIAYGCCDDPGWRRPEFDCQIKHKWVTIKTTLEGLHSDCVRRIVDEGVEDDSCDKNPARAILQIMKKKTNESLIEEVLTLQRALGKPANLSDRYSGEVCLKHILWFFRNEFFNVENSLYSIYEQMLRFLQQKDWDGFLNGLSKLVEEKCRHV